MNPNVCRHSSFPADNTALVTERRDLVVPHDFPWPSVDGGYKPSAERIVAVPSEVARQLFLNRWIDLRQ